MKWKNNVQSTNFKKKASIQTKKKRKKKNKKFPFQSHNELAYLDNVPYWKKLIKVLCNMFLLFF